MRHVTIKELRSNLSKELESVPFIITSRGKAVAKCTLPDDPGPAKCTPDGQSVHSESPSVHQAIDAEVFVSRYNDAPLNLSKEAQAKGHMGH